MTWGRFFRRTLGCRMGHHRDWIVLPSGDAMKTGKCLDCGRVTDGGVLREFRQGLEWYVTDRKL